MKVNIFLSAPVLAAASRGAAQMGLSLPDAIKLTRFEPEVCCSQQQNHQQRESNVAEMKDNELFNLNKCPQHD